MKYRVIKFFMDLQDGNHAYNVGDEYPRKGLKVTDARIAELTGNKNKQGKPLIEPVAEEAPIVDAVEPVAEPVAEEAPKKKGGKK